MTDTDPDIRYGDWTPQDEILTEVLDPVQAKKLAATLDLDEDEFAPGAPVPAMWHWIYFLPRAKQSTIGTDGHPKRGGFFPPVELTRRMFAGQRTTVHRPLLLGREATRRGRIVALDEKSGARGRMVLATARYTIEQDGETCFTDEHDVIYLDADGKTPEPGPDAFEAPADATWHRSVTVDPVMLFRYSALIFNGHRIHYDRDYTRDEEGYPGLVVTGPLTATLLADLARYGAERPLAAFSFRGRAPLFDSRPFHLIGRREGDSVALEARRADGVLAMTATAALA